MSHQWSSEVVRPLLAAAAAARHRCTQTIARRPLHARMQNEPDLDSNMHFTLSLVYEHIVLAITLHDAAKVEQFYHT